MGNEQSHLGGLQIEQKSVEVADFWSHHFATILNAETTTTISVFIGELFVDGALWKTQTPLEKNSKHLMIYRHPFILRYISSWSKGSKFYLAIEEVTPLSHILANQNTLQICINLYSIIKALCFLHEKAEVSHNNVCTAAIYVTKDGDWKLGGMEYLCKFSELKSDYLAKTKTSRYTKAVDPNEASLVEGSRKDCVDVYAFGVLVGEVLKNKNDDEILSLTSFRDYCTSELQNIKSESRPKLSELLQHEFFNNDFISIHSFLTEIPLKSDEEKTQFFHGLVERLRGFPEVTVASQFGSLLLSRLVLLNKIAQEEVIPYILNIKDENQLISEDTFKKYLVAKLLKVFQVRDSQIRLLLLAHFNNFVHAFSKEELQTCILPELLVGVKDTNDHLVAVTLRTLSDLVPILGATTVIGGKRAKLFNDGRPTTSPPVRRVQRKNTKRIELPIPLPERSRPDGEEEETSTEEAEPSVEEDLDNWEDWGENANIELVPSSIEIDNIEPVMVISTEKKSLPDISELDIKAQTDSKTSDEFDFFHDMEPVIETSAKVLVAQELNGGVSSKLEVQVTGKEEEAEIGWGDDLWN